MSGILLGAKPNIEKPATVRAFGVEWAGGPSTQLTRLGAAAGFSDPVPGIGTSDGSSPFDDIMPWAGMKEFNVINDAVFYEKGVDAEFTRAGYDTVVRIPKFWYKVDYTTNWQLWIANGEMDGFTVHPAFEGKDYIYVGKYTTGTGTVSKSGVSPLVNVTRAQCRTNARNKGSHWDLIDFKTYSALWMLYLVEYADWDSQAAVGNGYTSASAVTTCGGTDSVRYHTGRGTDVNSQIKYRGIEDLWGNAWQWCDGINFSGTQAYYCTDRSKYADDTSTNYTRVSFSCVSGSQSYPTRHGYDSSAPWVLLPSAVGGSTATYIPDGWWTSTNWRVFRFGGRYDNGLGAGLFARSAYNTSSYSDANNGGRLLFIP